MGGISQDELYRRAAAEFGSALARVAGAWEADPEKRRDLSQDIHFQIWRSFERYDARCSMRTWVYRVAHHVAVSHALRERRRFSALVSLEEIEALPDRTEGSSAADQRISLERLSGLIQRLRPLDRQVIVSYLEDMDAAVDRGDHGAVSGQRSDADSSDQKHSREEISSGSRLWKMISAMTT